MAFRARLAYLHHRLHGLKTQEMKSVKISEICEARRFSVAKIKITRVQ